MFRPMKTYQVIVDGGIAALFFLLAAHSGSASRIGVVIGMTVALALRRRSPALALAAAWVSALTQMYVIGAPPGILDLAILPVLYATTAYGRLLKWAGLVSVGVGALLGSIYLTFTTGFGVAVSLSLGSIAQSLLAGAFWFIVMVLLLGLPWTAGLLVRTRSLARLNREAAVVAQAEAEAAEQGVIVEQERNRIARDMHDVVAHSLAVVIAQADGARYAGASHPGAADEALATIAATAREALADVRLLLGQLRHAQPEGPQPSLDDLGRLLEQLRSSGLPVEFETRGEPVTLGTAQQLAVYRIVQEALTNSLRHGDTSRETRLIFGWGDVLDLTVSNHLRAPAEPRVGHGLAGMRERAALVGGRFEQRQEGDRYVVRVVMPLSVAA